MKMRWTKKNYIHLALGTVASLIIIYAICYYSLLSPLIAEVTTAEEQISQLEQQAEMAMEGADASEETELTEAQLKVPATKSPETVLINLEQLAESAGVTIEYLGAMELEAAEKEEEESTSLETTSYTMDASAGNLSDINRFLESITASERLMLIDTLDVQQTESDAFATVTLRTFYLE
ncbi:hypothetical protein [Lentibacillus sediminis]|uniref:hypothetical protein n=1 Tax=Lentibacillus sediminis TaxID=1940529 RepID=UPI000C1C7A4F|nr:hypothetical protein [Lentibacillus sediminis]